MDLNELNKEILLIEGKLIDIAKMVVSMSPSAQEDASFGKFVSRKSGYMYKLYLVKPGVTIELVEYMTGGDNPYVKFHLPKDLSNVVPLHLIGSITTMFMDIYNNGAGELIEGQKPLTKVIAKRTGVKAIGSKAVTVSFGQTLVLDRKTPPGIEKAPDLIIKKQEVKPDTNQQTTD